MNTISYSFLLAGVLGIAAPATGQSPVTWHTGATVITGATDRPVRDATLVVSDGKIQEIRSGSTSVPAGVRHVDLPGRYVMPGLIDAHTHIATFDAARRALLSGLTTARSMGVDFFADVRLRSLALAVQIESPEFVSAGYHVRPRPVHRRAGARRPARHRCAR